MNYYSLQSCENIINKYLSSFNGEANVIKEGVLGLGTIVLSAANKKTVIINEVFVNAWNSTHTVRMYNKTPKKYLS